MPTPVKIDYVVLQRGEVNANGTFGEMRSACGHLCYTLEHPWKDNAPQISCIPPGTYKCKPHSGERFKDVWEVTGVPKRTAILIHVGNTLADTHGCILVGQNKVSVGVTGSKAAMVELHKTLADNFILEVRA